MSHQGSECECVELTQQLPVAIHSLLISGKLQAVNVVTFLSPIVVDFWEAVFINMARGEFMHFLVPSSFVTC